MIQLTRSQTVLQARGKETYVAQDEETNVVTRLLHLDLGIWRDLGQPDTVTLTVEPGDTLN